MHLGAEFAHLPSLVPDRCPLSDDCLPPNRGPSVWTVPKQIRSNADGYAGRCKGWLPLQGRPSPVGRFPTALLRPAVCPDILEPRKDPRLFFWRAGAAICHSGKEPLCRRSYSPSASFLSWSEFVVILSARARDSRERRACGHRRTDTRTSARHSAIRPISQMRSGLSSSRTCRRRASAAGTSSPERRDVLDAILYVLDDRMPVAQTGFPPEEHRARLFRRLAWRRDTDACPQCALLRSA